jgi:hypothetical protein
VPLNFCFCLRCWIWFRLIILIFQNSYFDTFKICFALNANFKRNTFIAAALGNYILIGRIMCNVLMAGYVSIVNVTYKVVLLYHTISIDIPAYHKGHQCTTHDKSNFESLRSDHWIVLFILHYKKCKQIITKIVEKREADPSEYFRLALNHVWVQILSFGVTNRCWASENEGDCTEKKREIYKFGAWTVPLMVIWHWHF